MNRPPRGMKPSHCSQIILEKAPVYVCDFTLPEKQPSSTWVKLILMNHKQNTIISCDWLTVFNNVLTQKSYIHQPQTVLSWPIIGLGSIKSGGCFRIRMPSYQVRNSHYEGKMVSWPSYLYNGKLHTRRSTDTEPSLQCATFPRYTACFFDAEMT